MIIIALILKRLTDRNTLTCRRCKRQEKALLKQERLGVIY